MTGRERSWHLVHTQPQGEARAEVNLRRQGFEVYLPKYCRTRRHARKSEVVVRPLFPRYLFIALDLATDRWRNVKSTIGVNQLVLSGEAPANVPQAIVREIRSRENDAGYIQLSLPADLTAGSAGRIVDGIFADAPVVIEQVSDARRVAVLLSLFGREVRVSAPVASIVAA